jgi:tRNA(Ile)-lysidine synthase
MKAEALNRQERLPLVSRFEEHLKVSGLLPEGADIAVALSGGLDSVVLLDLLLTLRKRWRWTISAAHFDHRMRQDSGEDAAWVSRLCGERGVPCRLGAAERAPAGESEARELRYEFLQSARDRLGARLLVTAHQADDQAETVLFRMLRGSGLSGLAGIPQRREPGIVRPLLPYWRREIEDYAAQRGLDHVRDPSNLDPGFARNRIRNDLIPAIEGQACPDLRAQLQRLADLARRADRAVGRAAEKGVDELVLEASESRMVVARTGLLAYDTNVRAHLLRAAVARLGPRPGRVGTRVALEFINTGNSGRGIDLAGGVEIRREFDSIVLERRSSQVPPAPDEVLSLPDTRSGQAEVRIAGEGWRVLWTLDASVDGRAADDEVARFDPSELRFPLAVRSWRAGDRIQLPAGTRKLKKLFVDRRVGLRERGKFPVLVDGSGVLWVIGLAKGARAVAGEGDEVFSVRFQRV